MNIDLKEPGTLTGATVTASNTAPERPAARIESPTEPSPYQGLFIYLAIGVFFGVVLVKSEVVSWFRIQEMFRFDSFHMYGIIGSAVAVAAVSVQLIKRLGLKTADGRPISVPSKAWGRGVRYWAGGIVFGLGWALLGACPGPMFALIGGGVSVMIVALAGALAGTWAYSYVRPKLPH